MRACAIIEVKEKTPNGEGMSLGEKIQYYRKKKGLMQSELGELLFVTRQTVSLWEKGQTVPSIDNLIRLSEIFGVTIDHLVNDKEDVLTDDAEDKKESASASVTDEVRKNISDNQKPDNDNKDLQKSHTSYVFYIAVGLFAVMLIGFIVSIFAMNVSISDKRIEKILAAELPEYSVRMVSRQRRESGRVKVRAITEISFDADVTSELSQGMDEDMPQGLEKVLTTSFAYQDAELYLLYDFDRGCAVTSCTEAGSYVLLAYYSDVNILRATEFRYK